MMQNHIANPEDTSFRFYITKNIYFDFEISIPFREIRHIPLSTGYYYNISKKLMVFWDDDISAALCSLYSRIKIAFAGVDPIKSELFENGAGFYINMRYFYMDPEGDPPEFDEKYPDPSVNNQSLTLWETPVSRRQGHTWMYHHQGKVYIEIARIYDWDECDEKDYENFHKFMKTNSFDRYEISPDLAETWIEYMLKAAEFSPILKKQLELHIQEFKVKK